MNHHFCITQFLNPILTFCVAFLLCIAPNIYSQNLVPNPGFEDVIGCDVFIDCWNNQPSPCPPWICAHSINFFNSCSTIPAYDVPYNFRGYQYAHSGEGYVGGYQKLSREYIQVQLMQPMIGGKCYTASMYVSNANESCAITKLGMLFTREYEVNPIGMDPQVEGTGQYYTDTLNWILISGSFISLGEEYLTIGNLYTNIESPYHPDCADTATFSYYYFDDIVVEESTTEIINFNLGGPYENCYYVNIEPNIQNNDVSYLWSDGSTAENLIVTTSGTYSLTVYDHATCSAGIDSVDVIVLGEPPIYFGPDTILCLGETLTLTVGEFQGVYAWSDGSTDHEFTISNPGIYGVTFDDGCSFGYDYIEVSYLSAPQFSLGADTILCPEETYLLHLDPSLGDFTWDNNSHSPFYFIVEPGLYSVTISNQCGETADQIEVTFDDPPVFDLGPDSTVFCIGNTINLQYDPTLGDFQWQDGNTNSQYTINSTGLYSLTVSNFCGTLTDEMYVEQISVPVVVLGGSIELCPGESEIIDPGYNYGDYVWQDGSTDQVYVATTSDVYSVTVTNVCGMDEDSVVVEVAPPIVPPGLGPDVSLCPGELLILAVSGQGANILWNDLSTNDTLLVTSSGTYHVQVSTFCASYSDTVVVVVQNSPPDINLPLDFALCDGLSVTLDAGITNVTYLWNDSSQLSQLSVSTPGVYSLTVSNACGTDVDSVTVSGGGLAPEVSLGQDTALCAGSSITIFPSFANVDAWSWPDGSDTTFYVASSTGQVFVEASNACGSAYDTIQIGLLPSVPTLDLGRDTSICPGEVVTLSIQIPGVDILWPDGSSNQSYSISDSSIVIGSISNVCGISIDSIEIHLLPHVPLLDLGPDQTLCPGESITISPGINGVQYLWHDGSTANEFQTTQPDTIVLMVSNVCGSTLDSMIITESTMGPQLDLGPDLYACEGSIVTIPAGILGVNYLWQDGTTDDSFVTSSSGIFHLTVDNLCGTDSDTIIVDISGSPPSVNLGTDTIMCVGSTLTLISTAVPPTSIVWQDGSTDPIFNVVTSGIYHLTESNQCGTDSDSIEIEINGMVPLTNLGPDATLCEGETLVLTSDADAFTSSTWQDGSTSNLFEVLSSGTYHLTQSNACGTDRDTIVILIEGISPSPYLGSDTSVCEGTTLLLSSNAESGTTSLWHDGSTGLTFLVNSPGTYSLTQSNHCGEGADTIEVNFRPAPASFDLGADILLCEGETTILEAPLSTDLLEWQDGTTTSTYFVNVEGTYTLTISNECGTATDQIEIGYYNQFIDFAMQEVYSICAGDVLLVDASQSFTANYLWSTGSTLPSITITTPGTYSVTVRTDCVEASHAITVSQDDICDTDGSFYIPNVFSPNEDNINDVFIIVPSSEIDIQKMEGTIYDRWGGVVFQSKINPFTWDGRMNGQDVNPGVYIYQLNIKYLNNGIEYSDAFSGDVTVVK